MEGSVAANVGKTSKISGKCGEIQRLSDQSWRFSFSASPLNLPLPLVQR